MNIVIIGSGVFVLGYGVILFLSIILRIITFSRHAEKWYVIALDTLMPIALGIVAGRIFGWW